MMQKMQADSIRVNPNNFISTTAFADAALRESLSLASRSPKVKWFHHAFGICSIQRTRCSCMDLHLPWCILSSFSAQCPFGARYGLIGMFITGLLFAKYSGIAFPSGERECLARFAMLAMMPPRQ
jgi:hypothetical protein